MIGYENLRKPQIAAAIEQARAERSERCKVTADEVVLELKKHAFGDMRDFFDTDGCLLDVNELPGEAAARLSSMEVLRKRTRKTTTNDSSVQTLEQTIKIKITDAIRALELLGRHLGMFKDHQDARTRDPYRAVPKSICHDFVLTG